MVLDGLWIWTLPTFIEMSIELRPVLHGPRQDVKRLDEILEEVLRAGGTPNFSGKPLFPWFFLESHGIDTIWLCQNSF